MITIKASAAFSTVVVLFMSCNFAYSLRLPSKRSNDDLSYLPACEADAICGTVHLTSRGVTAQPLCSCPGYSESSCPMVWEMTDPRSVHQGSIQYKHCRERSRHIRECAPEQTAYTMKILTPFSEDDEDNMKISHQIHCTCPENYQQIQQSENMERIPFVGEIKTYSLTCAPYPTCGPEDVCKTLSERNSQFMENELCKCSAGFHCPVTGNTKSKSFDFGFGKITQLFCQ